MNKIKIDSVQRIAIGGLLLALIIIFTRFLSFQNIPLIPFVRISIGPALIIFASLLLGPIYGGVIGGLSDILGIILVPNALGYSINPFFTLIYTLLGVLPWCVFKLVNYIKSNKLIYIISISILVSLFIFLTIFLLLNDAIVLFSKQYNFELYQKILIIVICSLLISALSVGIYFIDRYFCHKNKDTYASFSSFKVAFTSIVVELLVLLVLNSIVKMIYFEIDFLVIFFTQSIVFIIDVALDSFIVTLLLYIFNRQVQNKGGSLNEK